LGVFIILQKKSRSEALLGHPGETIPIQKTEVKKTALSPKKKKI